MRTMLSGLVNISVLSWEVKAEFSEGFDDPPGVLRIGGDPDIHILRCPGVAVEGNGVAADEEILDALSVEKSQELSEVWR